ncbi:Molybdopterin or thiamine biosynthesis adenylyltransferase [Salinihabitans flavidus]|uniref:Molybdopterin or thiamine biosynthesis adenylyltransferase n=1 Tax=Salinihabitans flavidus TaxID=569882 RepID=A0A1H8NK64_9RHOB|nr:HesA/MoeB/ThiF family protein [Salinihabitans flavidus]SEO29967.1 Molybdopterin or thiamine biosynthesis adenylyltransferase [Salinihabitans flavidus]
MSRYARQTILPSIGAQGQAALARAHVLVVGAGGLGVPVLQYLAGAGVGRITLVDGDRVEEGNLHRQPLYRMDQIGQPKARAAAKALDGLNPDVTVTPICAWLDPSNAPAWVAGADVVLDCADSFAVSLTLSDLCRDAGRPLIAASALGLSGYVAGCCGGAPSLRAIFPDLPERGATCATAGVMGPVVGTIGALQAQMALAVLLKQAPTPLGRLVSLDAVDWRVGGFRFDRAEEPPAPLRFIARGQIRPDDLLIDLRREAAPFTPAARHVPPEDIATLNPPEGTRVVLACATGLRAHNAGQTLQPRWQGDIALLALHD